MGVFLQKWGEGWHTPLNSGFYPERGVPGEICRWPPSLEVCLAHGGQGREGNMGGVAHLEGPLSADLRCVPENLLDFINSTIRAVDHRPYLEGAAPPHEGGLGWMAGGHWNPGGGYLLGLDHRGWCACHRVGCLYEGVLDHRDW